MHPLQEVQTTMKNEIKVHKRDLKDLIVFMSVYSDIDWTQKDNRDICRPISSCVSACAKDFPTGSWTFVHPGDAEHLYGSLSLSPSQTRRQKKLHTRNSDAGICREWPPSLPMHGPIIQWNIAYVEVVEKALCTTTRNLKLRS